MNYYLLLSNQLSSMNNRFDKVEDALNILKFMPAHMSEKLDGLDLTVKYSDHNIRRDLKSLHEDVDTIVEILKIHDRIPLAK